MCKGKGDLHPVVLLFCSTGMQVPIIFSLSKGGHHWHCMPCCSTLLHCTALHCTVVVSVMNLFYFVSFGFPTACHHHLVVTAAIPMPTHVLVID